MFGGLFSLMNWLPLQFISVFPSTYLSFVYVSYVGYISYLNDVSVMTSLDL